MDRLSQQQPTAWSWRRPDADAIRPAHISLAEAYRCTSPGHGIAGSSRPVLCLLPEPLADEVRYGGPHRDNPERHDMSLIRRLMLAGLSAKQVLALFVDPDNAVAKETLAGGSLRIRIDTGEKVPVSLGAQDALQKYRNAATKYLSDPVIQNRADAVAVNATYVRLVELSPATTFGDKTGVRRAVLLASLYLYRRYGTDQHALPVLDLAELSGCDVKSVCHALKALAAPNAWLIKTDDASRLDGLASVYRLDRSRFPQLLDVLLSNQPVSVRENVNPMVGHPVFRTGGLKRPGHLLWCVLDPVVPLSRAELLKRTGLSTGSVSTVLRSLAEHDLVVHSDEGYCRADPPVDWDRLAVELGLMKKAEMRRMHTVLHRHALRWRQHVDVIDDWAYLDATHVVSKTTGEVRPVAELVNEIASAAQSVANQPAPVGSFERTYFTGPRRRFRQPARRPRRAHSGPLLVSAARRGLAPPWPAERRTAPLTTRRSPPPPPHGQPRRISRPRSPRKAPCYAA